MHVGGAATLRASGSWAFGLALDYTPYVDGFYSHHGADARGGDDYDVGYVHQLAGGAVAIFAPRDRVHHAAFALAFGGVVASEYREATFLGPQLRLAYRARLWRSLGPELRIAAAPWLVGRYDDAYLVSIALGVGVDWD